VLKLVQAFDGTTTTLSQQWPSANVFFQVATAAGWTLEQKERDVIAIRKDQRMGTVALCLKEPENEFLLVIAPFKGKPRTFQLGASAAEVITFIREMRPET
jgi:hypothetical protein